MWGGWWIVAKVVVACSAIERFGLNKTRCVTVDVEAHVVSVEPDDGVRLRGCRVHQNLHFLDGVGGGRSLIGAYFVEHNKHDGVHGKIDVEKSARDALHACDSAFIKDWCG